ncbi:DUF3157 family protein [Hydrogenimonas cancrithermarum]|uniref:DUF4340 domain-containing protein n=1 Tax=Hydrogenimonas cancrithermarum TaxID=2993563 RepID=A0ABM8FMG0_9BACT|nr:DUF3157 family protein [Hydrogenimonas cancrithermarum]BDY12713.1 hypothetical protein HCR_10250 [Hydrogenimonas cancrithermarum]
MKRLFLLLLTSLPLLASQYATLKDGTKIILKDDGTWEKVEIIPENAVDATKVSPLAEKIIKALQGKWSSKDGKIAYCFQGNRVTFTKDGKSKTESFKIENIEPDTLRFHLNAGETTKMGFFSVGGFTRYLKLSKDHATLLDRSETFPVTLHKVQ